MDKSIARGSSRVKFLAVLTVFAMAFAALALCPAGTYDADDGNRVTTWDELKDAINSAASVGDTIVLDSDISDDSKDGAVKIKNKNITIDLNGHKIDRQRGTPDGKDGRLFEISEVAFVTIKNGTLMGGHGDDGGCIFIDTAYVQLEDVIVTGNYSSDDGGAIWAKSGQVNIFGGQVTNNSCDGDGGAVYVENSSFFQTRDAKFSGNKAEDDGGFLYADESYYDFMNCDIRENYAVGNGGAICIDGVIEDEDYHAIGSTVFTENNADKSGGAIYINDGLLLVIACTFDCNWSDDNGGAIYAEDSDMMITSKIIRDTGEVVPTVFKGNQAPNSGGAVMFYGGEYELESTVLDRNYANGSGGAVYINNDSDVSFLDATFTANKTLGNGGAILVGGDDNKVVLKGMFTIKDNTSDKQGPNVFIRGDTKLTCDKIEEGSIIGISLDKGDGKFTKDFDKNNPGADPAKIFISNDSNYYVGSDGGEAKMYKSGTSGDMSDNMIWIIVGVIAAIIVVAVIVYVLKTRKSNLA